MDEKHLANSRKLRLLCPASWHHNSLGLVQNKEYSEAADAGGLEALLQESLA